jgi:hypothetical protein
MRHTIGELLRAEGCTGIYAKKWHTIGDLYKDEDQAEGRAGGFREGKKTGALETTRTILLRQLRKRFKGVPRKVEARIAATTNLQELQSWLDNFAHAVTLADVVIPPQ